MNKKEILKELEEEFNLMKKELGFKASLGNLDKIFFIKDAALGTGFVSENLSRQICARIIETYMNWSNYLHNLIMPNPGNMLSISESKMFNEEEKKNILKLITSSMELTSTNNLIGLTKDKKEEAKFIDKSLEYWGKTFGPQLTNIIKKINQGWKQK